MDAIAVDNAMAIAATDAPRAPIHARNVAGVGDGESSATRRQDEGLAVPIAQLASAMRHTHRGQCQAEPILKTCTTASPHMAYNPIHHTKLRQAAAQVRWEHVATSPRCGREALWLKVEMRVE